jgi:hypothetical protein
MAETSKNNFWTREMEAVVRHIKNQSIGYSWIYNRIVMNAKRSEKAMIIIIAILSGLLGTEGLITIFEYGVEWYRVATAVTGYVVMVLSIVNSTWDFGATSSEGLVAQIDFSRIDRSITYQLALHPKDRLDARDFVNNMLGEIDKLTQNAPTIDDGTRTQYTNKFKNNPIYNLEGQNVAISQETYIYKPNYRDNHKSYDFRSATPLSHNHSSNSRRLSKESYAVEVSPENIEALIDEHDDSYGSSGSSVEEINSADDINSISAINDNYLPADSLDRARPGRAKPDDGNDINNIVRGTIELNLSQADDIYGQLSVEEKINKDIKLYESKTAESPTNNTMSNNTSSTNNTIGTKNSYADADMEYDYIKNNIEDILARYESSYNPE